MAGRSSRRCLGMTVRRAPSHFPAGSTGRYGVVDKPDFALVIRGRQGWRLLVGRFRYPVLRQSRECHEAAGHRRRVEVRPQAAKWGTSPTRDSLAIAAN